jgi:hypothetical protein
MVGYDSCHETILKRQGTRMTRTEHFVLITTCFGHFMSHFNMLVFPAVVLPLAGRLDIPLAAALGISFWMYLLFGLTALPWGLIADRLGANSLMRLYYAGAGVCPRGCADGAQGSGRPEDQGATVLTVWIRHNL